MFSLLKLLCPVGFVQEEITLCKEILSQLSFLISVTISEMRVGLQGQCFLKCLFLKGQTLLILNSPALDDTGFSDAQICCLGHEPEFIIVYNTAVRHLSTGHLLEFSVFTPHVNECSKLGFKSVL